jgi:hypothetical protein
MNNTLHLIHPAMRLICTWTPTGDASKPLASRWVQAAHPQTAAGASSPSQERRIRLCA